MKSNIISISKEELEGRMNYTKFYTVSDVAKTLKKSEEQIRRYAREGKLTVYKEWKSYYIEESDLRDYMMIGDKIKIEIYKFFNFEYEHQVKFYNKRSDEVFKGAIKVLISLLNDFKIPLRDKMIEELKSI